MDKNRSHVSSPERMEEVRNLEQQELCLRRATASKGRARATRDATTEENARWFAEADRIAAEKSAKKKINPRGRREGIHNERHVRRVHGRIGRISVVVKVQTRILQAISEW